MKYRLTFVGVIAALIALLFVGYAFVPSVGDETKSGIHFTKEFWFNGYLIVLGFFLTSAAVGPIVSGFLDWRTNKEWETARRNARARLAESINHFIHAYQAFLVVVQKDAKDSNALLFLDETLVKLANFFETYTTEQVTFNPEMHSAASNIRRVLLPLQHSLATTKLCAVRSRSVRAYLHPNALNKFRALFDKVPLSAESNLSRDAYFSQQGKLFIDLQIDQQLGAGLLTLYRFSPLNVKALQADWSHFSVACGNSSEEHGKLTETTKIGDDDTQARLHAKFVRAWVDESYIVRALVEARLAAEVDNGH